jgi:hypothetical protein
VTFVFVADPSRVILVERSTAFRSAQAGLFVPFLPLGRIFVLRKNAFDSSYLYSFFTFDTARNERRIQCISEKNGSPCFER